VGLENGPQKSAAVVGELSPDGALQYSSAWASLARAAWRKGEIADAPAAEEDVRHASLKPSKWRCRNPQRLPGGNGRAFARVQ